MLARAFSRRALLRALPVALVAPAVPADHTPEKLTGRMDDPSAQDTSPELMRIICAHCCAYADLGQISRETDAAFLRGDSSATAFDRLDAASDLAEELLLALCRYPAANDAERHDKATYLLAIFEGDEPEPELMKAILISMIPVTARPAGPSDRAV